MGVKQKNKNMGGINAVCRTVSWLGESTMWVERSMNLQREDLIDQLKPNSADFEMILLKGELDGGQCR
jgi:hypothetical protein